MIEIRSCRGFDELEACVQLQIETWGYDESDVLPRKAYVVAQAIGGQAIGAFDTELQSGTADSVAQSMVGFVFSLPGVKTEKDGAKPYLHSHMLAVKEAYRNRGLGRQLKLEQRLDALSRGIRYIEWTFDPLEIKNAFLNISRLGATVRKYYENFYGVSSSRLQGGLPTDRLVAEWRLDSPRVREILDGKTAGGFEIEERITVPAAVYAWKASEQDRGRAVDVQAENRNRFQQAFSQGLAVLGFSLDHEGNGVFELGRVTSLEEDSI
jgi:predicted GNAT superfamily acetyltransferase